MKSRKLDAVIAGHLCLDMFPEFLDAKGSSLARVFIPGKLTNIGAMTVCTGGPVSNTGIAMDILGARVALMAKVGNDFIGRAIMDFLKRRAPGAETRLRISHGDSSSYSIVIALPGTDRIFLHNPGANDSFCYDDIDFDTVRQARLFHLGYPPLMRRMYEDGGEELLRIYRRVSRMGLVTSLDFALPDPASPSGRVDWTVILKKVLPYVDIFLPSVEEAQFMLDKKEFFRLRQAARGKELIELFTAGHLAQLSSKFLEYGGGIVGLKCGSRGIYVSTASGERLKKVNGLSSKSWANREVWMPSYRPEKFVSAAGAGDSAIAGFLAAFLKGKSLEACLSYASMCGAQNLRTFDTLSGLVSWSETTKKINGRTKKNTLTVGSAGWTYDRKEKLWRGPRDGRG